MVIQCTSYENFIETVAALVARGLGFKADAGTLAIKLTGAY